MNSDPPGSDMDRAVQELLSAQANHEMTRVKAEASLEEATAKRETAMHQVAELGLSRRTIAQMTGLSHTRVNQILEPRQAAEQTRRDEALQELASLSGYALADQMLAYVYSNSLSREEMAQATSKTVAEVNHILLKHAQRLAAERSAAAREMVNRHLPPEMRIT